MPSRRSARTLLAFIFILSALNSIGFGIILPVMPDLLHEVTGAPVGAAAAWGGWLLFVYALMQFAFAPVMGNLSDRFGRRPVLLIDILAVACDYLLMGWAPTVGWLFLGRAIAGAAGATFSIVNAYVADISAPEERPANMALMGAAFGIGFILGPAVGGLLGEYGTRVPFYGAAGVALANFGFGLAILPESLRPEHRRRFELRRANLPGAFAELRRHPAVLRLIGVWLLYNLGHHVLPSVWSFFVTEKFGWSSRDIGASLALVGIGQVVVSGWLIRTVIAWIGPGATASLGYAFAITAYVGYALAPTSWLLVAFLLPGTLSGFTAALSGILSNRVPPNVQGELQGAVAGAGSVASIAGPLFMTQTFSFFTGAGAPYFPGAPFLAAALLTVCAWAVLTGALRARVPVRA
jgi:DHA1 family tetracycline resistance protein-like MFS transporter